MIGEMCSKPVVTIALTATVATPCVYQSPPALQRGVGRLPMAAAS